MKSKLSTAKKSKTITFSRVFHPKKIDNFFGKLKLNFWTNNEDFEQCVSYVTIQFHEKISFKIILQGVGGSFGMHDIPTLYNCSVVSLFGDFGDAALKKKQALNII